MGLVSASFLPLSEISDSRKIAHLVAQNDAEIAEIEVQIVKAALELACCRNA